MSHNRFAFAWLWPLIRPHMASYAIAIVCVIGGTILNLADPLLIGWFIDRGSAQQVWEVTGAAALFFVAYATRFALVGVSRYCGASITEGIIVALRSAAVAHLSQRPTRFHESTNPGQLSYAVEQDAYTLGHAVGHSLVALARSTIMIVALLVGIAMAAPMLLALILVLVGAFAMVQRSYRRSLRATSVELEEAAVRRSSYIQEMLGAITQLQLLARERWASRRYRRFVQKASRLTVDLHRIEITYDVVTATLVAAALGALLGYSGWAVGQGELSVGMMVVLYTYTFRLFEPLATVVDIDARVQRARASASRLRPFLEGPRPEPQVRQVLSAATKCSCHDVSFAYVAGTQVIVDLNFSVSVGQIAAVIGKTGAGKSTLAKLLSRQYEPVHGVIRIDNVDLASLSPVDVRRLVTVVPQDPVIFSATLRENLLMAKPDASDNELHAVIREAALEGVVRRLPAGLHEQLGVRGINLSGGERQRVAVARALLMDPPILVLDESTSALDGATEAVLMAAIRRRSANRIVIMVTHRDAVLDWADVVLELSAGRLRQSFPERPTGPRLLAPVGSAES